ncbi:MULTISPECIES: molybdopterin converting factor subunit 1 [Kordiimonas]|jgi:molybdopterin synthase sulfur carrier subunit|nr:MULTISPECIES: molybdopterin converting factor subunit 1 [Kordiimonas]
MQLVYFSWIRERVGKSEESMQLPGDVKTVDDLIDHLCSINEVYQAALGNKSVVRVAVNQTHVNLDHPVTDADEVAFFPPVTGG